MRLRTGQVIRVVTAALLLTGASLITTSCGNFFVCEGKTSCPNSGGGSGSGAGTGDYVYASNNSSSATSLTALNPSTGAPVVLAGSPISLGYSTNAMVITPDNSQMFASQVGSTTFPAGAIFAYATQTDGTLKIEQNGAAVAGQEALAMDLTPDGKYLFALLGSSAEYTLQEFSVGSTGLLTPVGATLTGLAPLSGAPVPALKVAPSGNFVVMAFGTQGDLIVPLSSGLISSPVQSISTGASGVGDNGVTIDANNNIYLARTGMVAVYSATSSGVTAPVTNTSANSATGQADYAIVIAGSYLYVANEGPGTISAYSFTNGGVLTKLNNGTDYAGPAGVDALAVDNSGKYLVALGTGGSGIQEFAIGSSGALTASSTTLGAGASGAAPLAIVATH